MVKTMVMMSGELDFGSIFDGSHRPPPATWPIFIGLVLLLTIILMNLLVSILLRYLYRDPRKLYNPPNDIEALLRSLRCDFEAMMRSYDVNASLSLRGGIKLLGVPVVSLIISFSFGKS